MASLLDRLGTERHRRFVGRNREIELFQNAIAASILPFHILHIFGPGGVGKTSLLNQFERICRQMKISVTCIESRNVEPAPESFLGTLREVMNLSPADSPLQVLGKQVERQVIFIDTYEKISSLDEWLREVFLPQLPENTLIVIAGRNSPGAAWRSDPGWQALMQTVPLRNLSPVESLTYLTKREVPTAQHQAILDFTHGHPLALSLVADTITAGQEIIPTSAPDVIKTLLERFIQEVPTTSHRKALEACALVRITTETLLSQMLDLPDVHELFLWLRGLSFIESGQQGLFPHDIAREVLIADLRWRNPDLYTEFHHRARNYYTTHLQHQGQEKHRLLFDYMFLHRDNPAIRMRFTWQEHNSLLTDTLRESDKTLLLAMVKQHEGEESTKIAARWFRSQPENVVVFRSSTEPIGFAMMVSLHTASLEDIRADPAAMVCWRYLQTYAPLRPNEGATIFRFWMARDTYQAVSPTQSLIFINFVQFFQQTPALAYTFLPCADPEAWSQMLAYFDLAQLTEADFEVGGRRYGVYGHDWRVVSPIVWQQLLAQREIAATTDTTILPPASGAVQSLLVLSQPEFVEAVQDALRNFLRVDALQNNLLLRSRLIEEVMTTSSDRLATLQNLVRNAAESLQSTPRDEKLYRALYRTYLNPAPTQEQAAELLDLPFSTYRRHLKAGVMRLSDILWQREIS